LANTIGKPRDAAQFGKLREHYLAKD